LWFAASGQANVNREIINALSGDAAGGKATKAVGTSGVITQRICTAIIELRNCGRSTDNEKCAEQQSAEKVHSKPPWLHPPPNHVIRKIPPPK
jgi:hypothetical protein